MRLTPRGVAILAVAPMVWVLVVGVACSRPATEDTTSVLRGERQLDPPAETGALAPNLAIVDGSVAATWLEPVDLDGHDGHRFRFSRLSGESWSSPVTVAEGSNFFANWADLPAVVEMGNGDLLAHWLAKTANETYAYSIFLARSVDGGLSWQTAGTLNTDASPTEHGFVSWVTEGSGARAVWLDGRGMADGDPMTIRTAWVGNDIGPEEVLDERTCECCSTDAAMTTGGVVVVYRDRSLDEVRDVARVHRLDDGWSSPGIVHADGWQIAGCPVNGPEIAARGELAAVAWFTGASDGDSSGAGQGSAVKLAFSSDSGSSFDEPLVVDAMTPLGRVDVALDDATSAWVVWMGRAGEKADIRLARVDRGEGPGGARSIDQARSIATTSASRASGFPRLAYLDGSLYVSWVDIAEGETQHIRLLRIVAS